MPSLRNTLGAAKLSRPAPEPSESFLQNMDAHCHVEDKHLVISDVPNAGQVLW